MSVVGKCDVVICKDRDTFEDVIIPEEDRFLNMLVLGPTGTGKTSQVLLPMVAQDLLSEDCGITVIDPKEDFAEAARDLAKEFINKKVLYVDPTDENCPKINPFDGSEDVVTQKLLRIFAPSFLVSTNAEKREVDTCKNLIIRSIKLLKHFPELCGKNLNIGTFSDFITNKNNLSRLKLNKIMDKMRANREEDYEKICEWFLYEYFEPTKSLYGECAAVRMKVEDLATNKYILNVMSPTYSVDEEILNFDDHLLNGDIIIINTKNTILGSLGKTFGEFIMLEFLNATFRRKHYAKEKGFSYLMPHFLYIDEFATFSPILSEMFTQGRSFRVSTCIAVQNRQLLRMCGEQETQAQAFLIESNARNLIILPGANGEDADYYSKQFFNLEPAEICYRPFGQIVYRIVQNRNISLPNVGLVFFIDQEPNKDSIENEQVTFFKKIKEKNGR